ncbi:MAG: 16S rRNA (cytosine(1402)-N(4))-methyltransferase RsmH [Clostridiales bacterium]|nr:16S rRNA (cytosine(1402)-N(4))-methyltransferase RsmH [Clostridiales bacterium]
MEFSHKPVLLEQTVAALSIKPDGVYADLTAGGGGHSAAILAHLGADGRLICFDRDPDAVEILTSRFSSDGRVSVVHDNFSNIKSVLGEMSVNGVDGILADLGVSSHQLDTPERGFSFHTDAPLDMRMSRQGTTAAQLVNTLPETELARIIYEYGDEKFSRSIARNIVKARADKPVETTLELAEIIKMSVPAAVRRDGHPARKTFQALRIAVNGELDMLPDAIGDMFSSLNKGGVLAIISFHSLEDRIVKKSFASFCEGCTCPADFPICVCGKTPRGKQGKNITAGSAELEENNRSRSAKLRTITKL